MSIASPPAGTGEPFAPPGALTYTMEGFATEVERGAALPLGFACLVLCVGVPVSNGFGYGNGFLFCFRIKDIFSCLVLFRTGPGAEER